MSLSSGGGFILSISNSSLGEVSSCFCGLYLPCMARLARAMDRKVPAASAESASAERQSAGTSTVSRELPDSEAIVEALSVA